MIIKDQAYEGFFLPNFCGVKPIFILTIGAELLAIVLILATGDKLHESWDELGLLSIFVQWVALGSASILCLSRRYIARLPVIWSALVAYLIIIMVTIVISLCANHFLVTLNYQWGDETETVTEFVLRCVIISAIISLVALRYFYMQQQWKLRIQLESQAKVQALQSRIRPHFLFNSMNIIASLISTKPDLAEQAVEDLSELFRATLKETNSLVPLAYEWNLCRHYLSIEGLRLGDRLVIDCHFDDIPEDATIPMLTLQPLVENAIYHGIQPLPNGGVISLKGELKGQDIVMLIKNPVPTRAALGSKGNGMALDNIRHRLHLLFGSQAQLITEVKDNQYWATLQFPYVKVAEIT